MSGFNRALPPEGPTAAPLGGFSIPSSLRVSTAPPPSNESTLYVGNLNPRIDEQRLFGFFKEAGKVDTCRIMRDVYTGESRKFAFVSFSSPQEAEKVKKALNYEKLDGWELRISFKRNPSDFKTNANIFVKHLNPATTTKELAAVCAPFGKILSCAVRTNDSGASIGYGYTQYEDEASALAAIEKLNGTTLDGAQIQVSKFVPQKNRPVKKSNIYIKQFSTSYTKEELEAKVKEYFSKFGEISSMGLYSHPNPETKVASFYAFVAFKEETEAEKAIAEANGKNFEKLLKGEPAEVAEGETGLFVGLAMNKRQRKAQMKKLTGAQRATTNLFIKFLKHDVNEETLKKVFSKFGNVTSVCVKENKVIIGTDGHPLKFGFINFANAPEAETAIYSGKKDPEVLALVNFDSSRPREFLYFHQQKSVRDAYLRMKQKMQVSFLPPTRGMPAMFPTHFPNIISPYIVPPPQPSTTPGTTSRHSEKEAPYTVEWLKKNKKEFMDMNNEKQKNILGNLMFQRVSESKLASKTQIPKVTGMLIDMEILDYAEIIDILENDEALKERVNEALEILEEPAAN